MTFPLAERRPENAKQFELTADGETMLAYYHRLRACGSGVMPADEVTAHYCGLIDSIVPTYEHRDGSQAAMIPILKMMGGK